MSNIPEARRILIGLLPNLSGEAADAVHSALELMRRRRPVRKASPQSVPMSDAVEQMIVMFLETQPDATFSDIATWARVNPGRVSEVAERWKQASSQ